MKLYGYWRSSSTYRVRIVLGLKQLDYEYVPIHLVKQGGEQNHPSFEKVNAMRQVPVLEVEDQQFGRQTISQSVAIIEYLEETRPKPSLLPAEPLKRAQVRELVEIVNSGIQPLQSLRVIRGLAAFSAESKAWAKDILTRGLHALESRLSQTAGQHAVGDELTLADVFLIPQLYNARCFEINLAPFQTIRKVELASLYLPAFRMAHPEKQPDAPKDA